MRLVTVTAVYKLRTSTIVTEATTVKTAVGLFREGDGDLQDGISKLYRDVLVPHSGCELFSICHTVTNE